MALRFPTSWPMPLKVHKREGEPCPRCGTTIEAVFFSEHQTELLPRRADRRAGAEGPPALAVAEVKVRRA